MFVAVYPFAFLYAHNAGKVELAEPAWLSVLSVLVTAVVWLSFAFCWEIGTVPRSS